MSFTRKSGERDQLFGSVTSADIAHELEHKGVQIDRRKIQLDEPLKHVGEFNVPVKLHKDVTVQLKVVISKEAVCRGCSGGRGSRLRACAQGTVEWRAKSL